MVNEDVFGNEPLNRDSAERFIEPSDHDYRAFLSTLNFGAIRKIFVIANTGEVTVRMLREWLTRHKSELQIERPIEIDILLRSPHISDKKRFESVARTIKDMAAFSMTDSRFRIQVRYYASVCPLRATIFEHSNQTYSAYLSFCDWGPGININRRDTAHEHAFTKRNVRDSEPFFSVFLSWFRHFWGRHYIHTLIFDFDDTLFFTTAAQVHGWLRGIERAIESGAIKQDQLADDFREASGTTHLDSLMTDIFFEEQDEDKIIRRITKAEISSDSKQSLRRERQYAREIETLRDAMPIPNVLSDIQSLSTEYQLVIVSATSDDLIHSVLEKHRLSNLFSYVLGRQSPLRAWNSVENKAQNIIRVSAMLGVPLERMIFVGDSDADYRAAKQLSVPFIENKFNAGRYGRASLIRELENQQDWWVLSSNSGPGGLSTIIKAIESKVQPLVGKG